MDTTQTPKHHYYDGLPYRLLIDPALAEVRRIIAAHIPPNQTILDIGCGTGALVFDLAPTCTQALGLELSPSMIAYANHRKQKRGITNVEFRYGNLSSLPSKSAPIFDYAVLSMVIHEMPKDIRIATLNECKRRARHLLIADYVTPLPRNIWSYRVRGAEFLAGKNHFSSFIDFQKNGGLSALLDSCGLTATSETKIKNGTISVTHIQIPNI